MKLPFKTYTPLKPMKVTVPRSWEDKSKGLVVPADVPEPFEIVESKSTLQWIKANAIFIITLLVTAVIILIIIIVILVWKEK